MKFLHTVRKKERERANYCNFFTELNKRNAPFSVAPGAERRRSSSSNSTGHGGSPRDTNW